VEVSVAGAPALGSGLQIDLDFQRDADVPAPVVDDMPGSPIGCKVWDFTPAEAASVGLDQGTVTITAEDGVPVVPPCTYQPVFGYGCTGDRGAGGEIGAGPMPSLWTLTQLAITDPMEAVGSYVVISGAATASNNGAFPVLAGVGTSTVIFANPAGAAETLPPTATFAIVAGLGPIPGAPAGGFLEDDETLTVTLEPGGDGLFEAFSADFPASGIAGVGDAFVLDTESSTAIADIPMDGSEFSIGCSGPGGECGMALGNVLLITTTDGAIPPGAPPTFMPPPATRVISLRCASLGDGTVTVSPAASAQLMASGATRIRTTFLRVGFVQVSNSGDPPAASTIVAGHGVAGFTTP
jgi:hypothetical protein